MGLESKQHYAAIGGGITGEWIGGYWWLGILKSIALFGVGAAF